MERSNTPRILTPSSSFTTRPGSGSVDGAMRQSTLGLDLNNGYDRASSPLSSLSSEPEGLDVPAAFIDDANLPECLDQQPTSASASSGSSPKHLPRVNSDMEGPMNAWTTFNGFQAISDLTGLKHRKRPYRGRRTRLPRNGGRCKGGSRETTIEERLTMLAPDELSKKPIKGKVYDFLKMTRPNLLDGDIKPSPRLEELHPKLRKLERKDAAHQRMRKFYSNVNPKGKYMLAGYTEDSLHPLTSEHPKAKKRRSSEPGLLFHNPANNPALSLSDVEECTLTSSIGFQEEAFHAKPSVRLVIPDHLKAMLVDDWENVTKNLQLVPLPAKEPVNKILSDYFEQEKGKRRLGSAEADILEEVVQGVREYFDKCIGRILLYRFEREQFFEIRSLTWEGSQKQWEGKGPADVYGAEHLCRLFGECLFFFFFFFMYTS
jgi:hypothetical protein